MAFYNPEARSIYNTSDYKIDPGRHTNTNFVLTYDEGIFVSTYSSYSYPDPENYSPDTHIRYQLPNYYPFHGTV